jgi:superfamily II DNA or RNA helicase
MWATVGNANTKLSQYTEMEIVWLDHYLGIPDPAARFKRHGDGRRPMLNQIAMSFPTGLLPIVIDGAVDAGYKIEVIDKRVAPVAPDLTADTSWLLPFQDEALEVGLEKKRGIFHAPTGAGKTELMIALTMSLPTTWGLFVPAKSLLEQIASQFELRTGEEAGRIGEGVWHPKRVTVATFQSVFAALKRKDERCLDWLASLGGFSVDEVHTLPADTYWRVAMACPNAYYRFGYSATPFARGDRKGLLGVAAIGPGIYKIEQKTLADAGVIAKARIELIKAMLPLPEVEIVDGRAYKDVYRGLIVQPMGARNALVMGEARRAKKPALLFVSALEHGRELSKHLTASGIPSEFVWGDKESPERVAAVRRLEHGDVDVLIANVVFQAGVNIPTLATVINAAGGKSHIAALQQAGRGSRRLGRDGSVVKDHFTVVDFLDEGCGCGRMVGKVRVFSHKPCEWLHNHARSRRRAYLGEGYEVIER